MIQLPNNKKCYNLPEQVAQNLLNIQYLAEQYKNIDELPAIWQSYKEIFDGEQETFEGWTTTFEGWDETLATYLANMSSAAVGAIAGQNIAPGNVASTGTITANEILENMSGYTFTKGTTANITYEFNYAGVVKTGNKITFAVACSVTRTDDVGNNSFTLGSFSIPLAISNKLYPQIGSSVLCGVQIYLYASYNSGITLPVSFIKWSNINIPVNVYEAQTMTLNQKYYLRFEATFLLSDNLAI